MRQSATLWLGLGYMAVGAIFIAPAAKAQVFSEPVRPKAKPRPKVVRPVPRPKRVPRAPQVTPSALPLPVVPAPYVGAVPRGIVGEWSIIGATATFKIPYRVVLSIIGGRTGQFIGRVDYASADSASRPRRTCATILRLISVVNDVVLAEEVLEREALFCPGGKRISLQIDQSRLFVRWLKNKSDKVTIQSWADRVTR